MWFCWVDFCEQENKQTKKTPIKITVKIKEIKRNLLDYVVHYIKENENICV